MEISFTGKRALVTASSGGIGFSIARQLAVSGAEVVVNGRSEDSVGKAVEEIKKDFPNARLIGVAAELSTAQGTDTLLQAVGDVDILVNNFGVYNIRKPFMELSDQDWEYYFQCNVMSGIRLSQHFLKGMLAKNWGRVVFISSESALNIPTDMVHYGVTKTALLGLARGLAKSVSGTGVTVNSVLPGPTTAASTQKTMRKIAAEKNISMEQAGKEYVHKIRPSSILQRPTSTDEVANMVVYVCSTQASGTTGAALRVDGGVVDSIV